MLIVDSMQKCTNPQADDGHQITEGCLIRACKANVWRSSLISNMCCYERNPYTINTTISFSMSKDGCVKATIDCVEDTPGNAKMELSVKNFCEKYASRDQLEEIKEMLIEQLEARPGCQENTVQANTDIEDPKVLLIGPGIYSGGDLEVLSLPDLAPIGCNIPRFPSKDYYLLLQDEDAFEKLHDNSQFHGFCYSYVGQSTSDGVLMCGGYWDGPRTSSCHLLTSSGYKAMSGLLNTRSGAASVVTPLGLWVIGGFDEVKQTLDTTEIWSNNQSRPHVTLPEAMEGACATLVNQTHVLLTTGAAAFLYSEEEGFTRIEDMNRNRWYHGCSLIDDSTVLVAGGYRSNVTTEYLDLTSLTWSPGPELPEKPGVSQILGKEVLGAQVGGHLLIGEKKIFKLEEDGEGRQWTEVRELKYQNFGARAFVVNQDVICKK